MTTIDLLQIRLDGLRDEHCYITSADVCCHCGDSECDGIGCIACLDPNDDRNHEAIENLHTSLREGQAWRVFRAVLEAGETALTALMLAEEALANANNQTVTENCETCGQPFSAQGPCDSTCTTCRLRPVVQLAGLPTAAANALLVPVYEDLSEEDALEGMADVIVQRQLDLLAAARFTVTRSTSLELDA